MTARPALPRRRDQKGNLSQADDLDKKLNKIINRTTNAIADRAREIVQQKKPTKVKSTLNA